MRALKGPTPTVSQGCQVGLSRTPLSIRPRTRVTNLYLGDDLQVFEVGPLRGQQLLGYEVSLVCGKLLDTNRKTR